MQPAISTPCQRRTLRMAVLLGLAAACRLPGADPGSEAAATESADDLLKINGQTKALSSAIERLSRRGALSKEENIELRLIAEAQEADMKAQEAATQAALAQAAAMKAHLKLAMAQLASQRGRAVDTAPAGQLQSADEPLPRRQEQASLPPRSAPSASFSEAAPQPVQARQPAQDAIPKARVVDSSGVMFSAPDSAQAGQSAGPAYERNSERLAQQAPEPQPAPVLGRRLAQEDDTTPIPAPASLRQARAEPQNEASAPLASQASAPAEAPATEGTEEASVTPMPATEGDEPEVAAGTMRVSYVPEIVKEQIREEVRQDLMNDAAKEGWATPGSVPDWVTRFRLMGDLRFRFEKLFYPSDNLSEGEGYGSGFWNFNAINTGSPYDINAETNVTNPPFPNVDQNRSRMRLRARLGSLIELNNGCSAGIRIATGENNSPVSENQSLGAASSGQGGDFSKYAVWLDRAYLTFERGGLPNQDFTATIGRFDNPFFATSMLWADDLAFDGIASQGKFPLGDETTVFFAGGAFPVYNTDLNFSTYQPSKFKSSDKWLWGAQLGADFDLGKSASLKFGAAFYYFNNIEGKVSSAMVPVTSTDAGDTDTSRPSFAQKGNTYIALRTITPTYDSSNKLYPQYQYFGLATPFHEMAFTTEFKYSFTERFQLSLSGELVKNAAFNRNNILANGPSQLPGPVNNNASDGTTYDGGDLGWITNLQIGRPALKESGDWNVGIGYRHVESDATVDGFCDSDFGGGGTNLKGYTASLNVALLSDVILRLRYMSAKQLAGPAIRNDLFQIDIYTRF